MPDFMMVEEFTGHWFYHIAYKDSFTRPLCGKNMVTMQTSIPMNIWGFVGHLKERYCDACKKIYDEEMVKIDD
jgi:hypothetical protein